jgi:phosphate:Na+ symporter
MRHAALIADEVSAVPSGADLAAHAGAPAESQLAMVPLERCAEALRELQPAYRRETLGSAAGWAMNAEQAFARVDTVRRFERLAHHAWRSAAHLIDPNA